jgi:hypothetical protein
MQIPLNEDVHFDVITSDPETASVLDADSTPTFSVYEEATDVAIVGPTNFTKRTSLTGNYRGTFTASAANGFEIGKWYSVIASATVNEFEGKCAAMRFRVLPAEPAPGYPDLSGTSVGGISGGGTGARTVLVTVQTSGAVAIQGALVRMTKGAESFTQTTNASGQCTFNLNDGTWTVSITAAGYSFAGTTLVVDGAETPTYTMTTNSVSAPANPSSTTGVLVTLDVDNQPVSGIILYFRQKEGPGTAGYSPSSKWFTVTSGVAGVLEYTGFARSATYIGKRGPNGQEREFDTPAAASFNIPEILGAP